MTTTVFLGAGASKAFGYPLTTELLPRILQEIDADTLFKGVNPDDIAIRSLFLRAWESHSNPRKPEVVVVQRLDSRPGQPTRAVYRAFFPAAKLTYRDDGLEGFLANPAAAPAPVTAP